MLGQRLRRWPNIKPAAGQHLEFSSRSLLCHTQGHQVQRVSDMTTIIEYYTIMDYYMDHVFYDPD